MLTFKTQFPLNNNKSLDDFFHSCINWIVKSPHTNILESDFNPSIENEFFFSKEKESIKISSVSIDGNHILGFRYERIDEDNITWITEAVAKKSEDSFIVSIQVIANTELPQERLQFGKKPYLIKRLLADIGGGSDGNIIASDSPIYLDENDFELAANFISATAGCMMPIIYVSATRSNNQYINPEDLARHVSGMAHVIVEPNWDFSKELMNYVDERNVYNGAIGIYWPDGIGQWVFMPTDDKKQIQIRITRKVRASLLSQKVHNKCTWSFLQETISRIKIENLKSEKSTAINEYAEAFDRDIQTKNEEITRLEAEISRIKYKPSDVKSEEKDTNAKKNISIKLTEVDLYDGERLELLLEAVSESMANSEKFSRRYQVFDDIVKNNHVQTDKEFIINELKNILRSYESMSGSVKTSLERLGFSISEDGKHYKLIFKNDGRFSFSLSKTSSDRRSGMNAFSDIKKKFF